MELPYAQIENLFVARHDIASEHRPAFRGRLQHLQRLNFPSDINTGKGRRAIYRWRQIIELAVCLDMLETGISPEQSVKWSMAASDEILRGAKRVYDHATSDIGFRSSILKRRITIKRNEYLMLYPLALGPLKSSGGEDMIFEVVNYNKLINGIRDDQIALSSFILIDIGAIVSGICNFIADIDDLSLDAVCSDFMSWAKN